MIQNLLLPFWDLSLLSLNSFIPQVAIGDKIWTSRNLDLDHFRNGDKIPEVRTTEEWIIAAAEKRPAWCYYENDPFKGKKFGKIYNWYAVIDPRGIAPEGWHIPTLEEWENLELALGKDKAGLKMKTKTGWGKNGSNEVGFSALSGGYRDPWSYPEFYLISRWARWFSCSSSEGKPFYYSLSNSNDFGEGALDKPEVGAYIRCVKNK